MGTYASLSQAVVQRHPAQPDALQDRSGRCSGPSNAVYGGDAFPQPDNDLTKTVLTDLPNVVGKSVDEATKILQEAGFDVIVGAPVDSTEAAGIVAAQNPGAGKVAGGTAITISPSNGQGVTVPSDVAGKPIGEALSYLSTTFPQREAGSMHGGRSPSRATARRRAPTRPAARS